jgi:hypothetical protein
MSVDASVCSSGAVLSVDDGVAGTGCDRRSACNAGGAGFESTRSVVSGTAGRGTTVCGGRDGTGVGRALSGGGAVGTGLGAFLTERTVDTGFDSSFTAGGCGAGFRSLLVTDGGGNSFGSAFTDACAGRAGALPSGTGIGLTGEDVNTFE